MINFWLDLPMPLLILALAVVYGGWSLILHALTFWLPSRRWTASLQGVVAPFFTSVAVLFALLTGFLGNDVWIRNKEASRAVLVEGDGLKALNTLSIAAVSDMSAIRTALRTYTHSVIADEWPRMENQESSPQTDAAMTALLREISNPTIARSASQAVHTAMLDTVLRVRNARAERLSLSTDRTNHVKWASVLILGAITLLAIALVHLERPRAQLAAVLVFASAAVVALSLIAAQEQPFEGPLKIMPASLEAALQEMTANNGGG
jgi:hypothetical protein